MGKRLKSALLLFGSIPAILSCSGQSAYKGPISDHFDGTTFHNQKALAHHGFGDLLRWMWDRDPPPWQEVSNVQPGPKPPRQANSLRATFINHATVLLQTGELNILTDPIWSERASPFSWFGPRRCRPPGIRFGDLPAIDVVIISHNHYDHMDLPTLKRLQAQHDPLFVVGLGNSHYLRSEGIERVVEIDWWQGLPLSETTTLTGVPAQHFSQRGFGDRDRALWLGYVISAPEGVIYFAGDTGMGPHFAQIRERFGPPHLSLLPIGAFRPRWFMAPVHLSPEEALQAHRLLASDYSIAIHFGTFPLADDAREEPLEALAMARQSEGVDKEHFWVLGFGEGREVPPPSAVVAASASGGAVEKRNSAK